MSNKKAIDQIEQALGHLRIADRRLRIHTAMRQASGVIRRGIEPDPEAPLVDGWRVKIDKMRAIVDQLDDMIAETNMPVTSISIAISDLEQAIKLLKEEEQSCTSE